MSTRGHRVRRNRAVTANVKVRHRGALIVLLVLLIAALTKLVFIQGVNAQAWASAGDETRSRTTVLQAMRGTISDRNGNPMAFTIEGRAIAVRPWDITDDQPLTAKDKPQKATGRVRDVLTADQKRSRVADILVANLGSAVKRADILAKLQPTVSAKTGKKINYVYVARGVLPALSDAIMAQIQKLWVADAVDSVGLNAVVTERQDIRQNPDGTVAGSVVGTTGWGGVGRSGIESKFNALLTGKNGTRTEQVDSLSRPIPSTATDETPAVNGTSITLTLDADLQYTVEQMLATQVNQSEAKGGCAVVKGITDGQIYAMACYQPGKTPLETGNPAVTTSFEPGSVNKVVTFAAALEKGIITPTTQFDVPGSIEMGGHNVHDAWVHGVQRMTAAGILGKSSNVGTLMIAQKVGQTAFAQELAKFGLGQKTGIQLPGEDSGSYPAQAQWSNTSFANLPIGQGVSMTLVQLVDMYQAIGNHGVLVSPTVIASTTRNGVTTAAARPNTSVVMKPTTAKTLLSMLSAPIQGGDFYHKGTGSAAAINGYQVAGKTGTAQQIDPTTHAYSATEVNATFAGVVPADHPKYAIAIMLDAPTGGSEGGTNAAPLFHNIAAYAMRAADVAPSGPAPAPYELYVPTAG